MKFKDYLIDNHFKLYYFFADKYESFKNFFYKILYPYNIVKCYKLKNQWIDRDALLIHTMCQIIVDFIELEHPFGTPENFNKRRFTDLKWMIDTVNSDKVSNYLRDDADEDEIKATTKWFNKHQVKNKELLYLYQWYLFSYPSYVNPISYYTDYDFSNGTLTPLNNGVITSDELTEIESDRELVIDNILHRIIKIRQSLWT